MQITFKLYASLTDYLPPDRRRDNRMPLDVPADEVRHPGVFGPINALSPKYAGDVSRIWINSVKPPVLYVYGLDDQIVSDVSFFDLGTLGAFGVVPGWPGADVFPSQPMVSQTRDVLGKYEQNGGRVTILALPDCGHTPYIEKPAEFNAAFHALINP